MKYLDGIHKNPHIHDRYYWWGGTCSECGKKYKKDFKLKDFYKDKI